ncbi:MAG: hypothetical protein AAB853_02950 [Patescibacteria group bacterium]
MKNSGSRPVVLIAIHNELIYRDLVSTGVLAALAHRFDFRFLVSVNIATTELEKIGTVAAVFAGGVLRSSLWNIIVILGSIHLWRPITGPLAKEYFNRKKDDNYSLMLRCLVLADRLGLAPALCAVGRWILMETVTRAVNGKRLGRPDLVVAPTGLRDLIADDLVRWGVRRKIPTIFLQINSDVFNMKVPTSRAAYFALWGDQSWYMARLVYGYATSRLKIIGSARFDIYDRVRLSRADARRSLDLPADGAVMLFCGGTAPFDEIRALDQLDAAIKAGSLPKDLLVLYKPHPKGQAKGATVEFGADRYEHIRLVTGRGPTNWDLPDLYPVLFNSVNGVISPYSTMGVEAALHGLPVLCVGYHPGRFERYWKWAREFTHLQVYRDKIWCVTCHDEREFLPGVQKILQMSLDPTICEAARNEVRVISLRDGKMYADRLACCFDEVLSEGNWRPG